MITKKSAYNEADWAKMYPNKPNKKVIFYFQPSKLQER